MKKLLLSVAIASALGLTGCGGDSIDDIKADIIESGEAQLPLSRISFDPANAVVSVPNDLLFSDTTDGTLNMPGETVEAGETINYYDPSTALGALDGWSTIAPMPIAIDLADGVTLDSTSAAQSGVVRVFEATLGGPLSPDTECTTFTSVGACKMGTELTYGVDFITTTSGDSLVVVPIKPLKAKQGYVLAVTNLLMDSNGNAIAPSSTYESVRLDVETLPLPLDTQLSLQTIINTYEDELSGAGVDVDTVIYSAGFTTQSTIDVLSTMKQVMVSSSPELSDFVANGYNVGQALAGSGIIDTSTDAGLAAYTSAAQADVYSSTLSAPYYLDTVTSGNCVLTDEDSTPTVDNCSSLYSRFEALGDSPITVLGALSSGVLSTDSFATQYAAQAPSFGRSATYDGNAANLVGINFTIDVELDTDGDGETETVPVSLDSQRHLTKFNPLAKPKSIAQIPVLITVPNSNSSVVEPTDGWPVVIYQHGITTNKETLFAFAGAMAESGVVVVAIDHPLHGERVGEMTLASGLVVPLGASDTEIADPLDSTKVLTIDGVATTYLNLASLLTARDNVRQSELDILALRYALNAMVNDATLNINPDDVRFYGHSLGALTGVTAVAVTNEDTLNPLTGEVYALNPYAMDTASFLAPGGGIPGFLLESPAFGGTVKAGLTASPTFQETLVEAAAELEITETQLAALKEAGADDYTSLVDAVYAVFSSSFNFAAQTILDAGDPINYASTIATNTKAIHLMEVVGNGADNLPDQVIPNTVSSPLSGTEPLASYMGLASISETTTDTDGVKGIVRFTDGHHSSILTTSLENGGSTEAGNYSVLTEMQKQLATFMATKGTTVLISDDSVIK